MILNSAKAPARNIAARNFVKERAFATEKNRLYIQFPKRKSGSRMMSFIDANIWGLLAMPFGLLFCFWPALLAWVKAEKQQPEPTEKRKDSR